ncbi:MAG: hypothetical protein ABIZ34_07380 [Candidatus Limnocylindrales bacterium]
MTQRDPRLPVRRQASIRRDPRLPARSSFEGVGVTQVLSALLLVAMLLGSAAFIYLAITRS